MNLLNKHLNLVWHIYEDISQTETSKYVRHTARLAPELAAGLRQAGPAAALCRWRREEAASPDRCSAQTDNTNLQNDDDKAGK